MNRVLAKPHMGDVPEAQLFEPSLRSSGHQARRVGPLFERSARCGWFACTYTSMNRRAHHLDLLQRTRLSSPRDVCCGRMRRPDMEELDLGTELISLLEEKGVLDFQYVTLALKVGNESSAGGCLGPDLLVDGCGRACLRRRCSSTRHLCFKFHDALTKLDKNNL